MTDILNGETVSFPEPFLELAEEQVFALKDVLLNYLDRGFELLNLVG